MNLPWTLTALVNECRYPLSGTLTTKGIRMLEPLGVDGATLAVYTALLRDPESTPEQLADMIGARPDEVVKVLDRLRELELLIPTWTTQDHEHAVHPRIGLGILAQHRRAEIEHMLAELASAEADAEKLAEQYNELLVARTSAEMEILEGRQRASRRIEALAVNAKSSFWCLLPAQMPDKSPPPEESPDRKLLERGIRTKFTYLDSMAASKSGLEYCKWVHELGGEVRSTPTLPMRLVIIDEELVIMPLDPKDHNAGAVIHRSPPVIALAISLFEVYWSRATNIFEADDLANEEPLTSQETEILRLLSGGAKDEQVARLLGISLRTARRITAGLAERVDAGSQFELGVAAARRGWV